MNYHLEKESGLKLWMKIEPHSARLNGLPIKNWTFDRKKLIFSTSLPRGEGVLIIE